MTQELIAILEGREMGRFTRDEDVSRPLVAPRGYLAPATQRRSRAGDINSSRKLRGCSDSQSGCWTL